MEFLTYSVTQVATQIPSLLVLVAGLTLAVVLRARLGRLPRLLLASGVVVLLVGMLLSLAWLLVLPRLYASGGSSMSVLTVARLGTGVSLVLALLHPAGLGLVIAAALTGRRPAGGG
ncbi:hypothetical protein OOK41_08235 [Micromonospora sp. NBC_01655]|uniref:hypothetical protein n=1 Tax=Micromonospora sp. NBC_01655 TaxID=2975983 RepID=UPI00224F2326|nr:hypothetical protein [Micromonospora sp. NBC_01655]MCX4470290.1 hypothetical protein [Micromonospora sp. NBC_01655]